VERRWNAIEMLKISMAGMNARLKILRCDSSRRALANTVDAYRIATVAMGLGPVAVLQHHPEDGFGLEGEHVSSSDRTSGD
jgi:hypothetical protein